MHYSASPRPHSTGATTNSTNPSSTNSTNSTNSNSTKSTKSTVEIPLHRHAVSTVSPPYAFHLYLCGPNVHLHKAWIAAFEAYESLRNTDGPNRDYPHLTYSIHNTTMERLLANTEVDCIVSPANSFGLMDGGVDYNISDWYGGAVHVIPYVQQQIEQEWSGQQNVGTSLIVDLHHFIKHHPSPKERNLPRYLAHVPTMRCPKQLDPSDDIIYRCMWALLASISRHNRHSHQTPNLYSPIRKILVFGFGAGVGQLPYESVAKQMAFAAHHFVEAPANGHPEKDDGFEGYHRSWDYATHIERDVMNLVNPK